MSRIQVKRVGAVMALAGGLGTPTLGWAAEGPAPAAAAATPTTEAPSTDPAPAAPAPAAPSEAPPAEAPPPAAAPPAGEPPPAPTPEQTSRIQLTPQGTMPAAPRTFHHHDGFYLRSNLGLGLLWGSYEREGRDLDADGSGLGFDLMIGGSPTPGFAIGGAFLGNWLFSADFEERGNPTTGHDVGSGLIGVFVDGFPQATGGWHVGGFVGIGGQTLSDDGVADETGGFGVAVFGGYDHWVSDDVSMGALLRLTAARTTGEKASEDISAATGTFGLMFSVLYH